MEKLIINAAITGTIHARGDNPDIPLSVDEIVADVSRCRDAGASIVHIHARDQNGGPSFKKEIYYDIMTRIRKECPDILICGSTSGRIHNKFSHRAEVLQPGPGCRPDLASLTLGSMNFPRQAVSNSPDMIQSLARAMNDLDIVPELECFDLGMVDYAKYLIDKGILRKPFYANIILGSLGTLNATPDNLVTMVQALPDDVVWSVGGIGRFQFQMNTLSIVMGGHVRVGLEDSLYYDKEKKQPATNPGLIERLVKVARAIGRDIATPEETRKIIGISDH